jgi:uncharacterized membrane protein YhaH (DUF805 family)
MNGEIKKNEYRERFVRWQSRMIDQLGFVNNLFIVLATGVLAFQTDFIFKHNQDLESNKLFLILSIFITLFSLVSGCYVAINRLRDFSTTRNIIRSRMKGEDEKHRDELRAQSKIFGEKTWEFLKYQIYLLLLSIFVFVIISINLLFFS